MPRPDGRRVSAVSGGADDDGADVDDILVMD